MSRPSLRWLAVILPLIVLGISAVRSELRLRASETWEFKVRGYDPRDLLRGRYINYRIDFTESAPALSCNDKASDCCLCLSRASDGLTTTQRMSCTAARDQCEGILRTSTVESLTRYYVPESRALEMERQLRAAIANREDARVILAIDRDGGAEVVGMSIGGAPLE